jgi:hypothetical protein
MDADHQNLARILVAAAPFLAEPPLLPPILQPTVTAELLAYLSLVTGENYSHILLFVNQAKQRERARPEQGGQRITEDWLCSLKNRDCEWRFRYASNDPQPCGFNFNLYRIYRMAVDELVDLAHAFYPSLHPFYLRMHVAEPRVDPAVLPT